MASASPLTVRGKHAVVARQVHSRRRHQRREARHPVCSVKSFCADGLIRAVEKHHVEDFPDETGDLRAIAPVRLPDHETAFAMTVHKSQGSEFEELLLVLPAEKNRVLSRELFYTAVTRARERLTIVANATVIAGTVETATKRVSGLLSRMR